jgi:hypothetical protein
VVHVVLGGGVLGLKRLEGRVVPRGLARAPEPGVEVAERERRVGRRLGLVLAPVDFERAFEVARRVAESAAP